MSDPIDTTGATPPQIHRERVAWCRYENGRQKITHPTVWLWTDPEGTVRSYDTKGEALAAAAEYGR